LVTVTPTQGEIWWAEAEDKRRPVLIVTRSDAVPVLTWIIVAPVTRTIRQIPTEVSLGAGHGLPDDCVASFDNLQPIRLSFLVQRVGELNVEELDEICRALRALADC
jgi:mRNA interferase MazF